MRSLYCKILFFLSASFAPFSLFPNAQVKQSLPDRLDEIVEHAQEKWKIPGVAVALVHKGKVVYAKGYGYRDLEEKKPVTPDTVFQIGSISKSFTATLAAMAVDAQKCAWDTRVQELMPDFLLQDPLATENFAFKDLFAQNSGLPEKTGDMQALLGYSPEEIIYNLRFIKPKYSFRSKYSYQNVFYLLAGKTIEKLMGNQSDTEKKPSFPALLKENIFTPLSMKDAGASFEEYLAKENRSSFYALINGGVVHIPDAAPFLRKVDQYVPAGGVHASALDVAKWLMFHIDQGQVDGKSLVKKQQMRTLRRPQIYVGNIGKKPTYYGLGWNYTESYPRPFVWHNGETFGIKSMAAFIPEEQLGIVVLTNLRGTKAPEGIVWDFFDAYFRKKPRDWVNYFYEKQEKKRDQESAVTLSSDTLPIAHYVGTYYNEVYGQARILEGKDHLILQVGPKSSSMALYPEKRDLFSVHFPSAGRKSHGMQFFRNRKGQVEKMTLDLFSEEGSAEFIRCSNDSPSLFGYL